MTRDEAQRLIEGLAAWAARTPACRALAVAGSWARGEARPDSDLDLVALTPDRDVLATDSGWLEAALKALGFSPSAPVLEVHGVARSWRVLAESGVELELTLAFPEWARLDPIDPGTRRVLEDGIRPLVDKDGLLARLLA